MNNLFSRTIFISVISIISFALVSFFFVNLGLDSFIYIVDSQNREIVSKSIYQILKSTSPQYSSSSNTIEALSNIPVATEYILVVDQQKKIVFSSKKGKLLKKQEWLMASEISNSSEWYQVKDNGQTSFWFAFKTMRIDKEDSSKLIITAIERSAAIGSVIAFLIGIILGILVSQSLRKQLKELTTLLDRLQQGQRGLCLQIKGPVEFRKILTKVTQLQNTLEKEEKLRRQWAADIAHDLRTPITVLKCQFEGMLDEIVPMDRSHIEKNYSEILRLENLIKQLGELSKIESPGYILNPQNISPDQALQIQINRFASTALLKNQVLIISNSGNMNTIQVDPDLLDRALANLIENALQYGDSDSKISLGFYWGPSNEGIFYIENKGTIPIENREFLFDRLFRGDKSRLTQGSGLGLAIVKAIAQAHEGDIILETNDENKLIRFTLHIPQKK